MDSKLVVEQMSGRWKIKHPDMRPLAAEAGRLAPFGTTYTWVPREQNKHADRLANEALDGTRTGSSAARTSSPPDRAVASSLERGASRAPGGAAEAGRPRGWAPPAATPTTLILVRHGVTTHTVEKRFSGGLGQRQPRPERRGPRPGPGRPPTGWRRWPSGSTRWSPRRYAAPRSRPRSSPSVLGTTVEVEPGFAEMEFGIWDGLTFARGARASTPTTSTAWLGSLDVAPGGRRVLPGRSRSGCSPGCERLLRDARRQDRGRRQPRDADQDAGRARARRAAGRRSSGWS